jgi:hypothetical protein
MATKLDREKRLQCWRSDCEYFETRCRSYHGNECQRIDGNKIPRMRLITPEERDKLQRKNVIVPAITFKPYFMNPSIGDGDQFESI